MSWLEILNTAGLALVAALNYYGNRTLHVLVNSRMTELLVLTRAASHAEGVTEGMKDEKKVAKK